MNRLSLILLVVSFLCFQCQQDDLNNAQIIEAEIGKVFTAAPGSVVVFKQIEVEVDINEFSDYTYNSILPPNTTVKAIYKTSFEQYSFELTHFQQVEESGNIVYVDTVPGDEKFIEEALLGDKYILVFQKMYWSESSSTQIGDISKADFLLKAK